MERNRRTNCRQTGYPDPKLSPLHETGAGPTIETLYPDRLSEQIDRLAHHALGGEVWEKALMYLREAGAKAMARSANREAVAYFQQALTVLAHLPESHETFEQAIDIRFELRNCLFLLGELDGVFGYLNEAEGLARAIEDDRRLGWVSAYMGIISGGWAIQRKLARAPSAPRSRGDRRRFPAPDRGKSLPWLQLAYCRRL